MVECTNAADAIDKTDRLKSENVVSGSMIAIGKNRLSEAEQRIDFDFVAYTQEYLR